jgi:hypothetical protein
MMQRGTFKLRRFSGDEVYKIESATIALDEGEGSVQLTFRVRTAEGAVQTASDTSQHPATPNAEATITLPPDAITQLVGCRLTIPMGYDAQ